MQLKQEKKLMPNLIKKIAYLLLLIIVFFIGLFFKDLFPVAVVDGGIITRRDFAQQLTKNNGKQTLNVLIARKLVEVEMIKRNIKISDSQINSEIQTIKKNLVHNDTSFKQSLQQQGKTLEQFKTELKLQELFKPNIKITDIDIDNYLSSNNVQKSTQVAIYESQKIAVQNILLKQQIVKRFQQWLDHEFNNNRVKLFVNL